MHHVSEILETGPQTSGESDDTKSCTEACIDCASTCSACADACLGEPRVLELVACIRLNLLCAEVCATTARALSTHPPGELLRSLLDSCRIACGQCGLECQRHAQMHDHCRVCADACRVCERACRTLLAHMGWT